MLPELHFRISARGTHTASRHGHSTTVSSATMPLLGVIGTTACDTRSDPLHLILTVELHLLQFDFFQEVFRIQVEIKLKKMKLHCKDEMERIASRITRSRSNYTQ